MATEIDDFTRHAHFVMIFTGDAPTARLHRGWDAMIAAVRAELSIDDEIPDYWSEMQAEMEDEDNWHRNDFGRFHYQTQIGDCGCLQIYRLDN